MLNQLKAALKVQIRKSKPVDLTNWLTIRPVSDVFGFDRGQPIDRYYIEGFLKSKGHCIKGDVLEIGDDTYTRRSGENISSSTVLLTSGEARLDVLIADLSNKDSLPSNAYDCLICTQTLNFIKNVTEVLCN